MPTRSPIPRTAAVWGRCSQLGHPEGIHTFGRTCVDVRGTRLERSICVGDGHSRVIVQVYLNVAAHDSAEGPHELIDLTGVRATDGVGDPDAVDANLVDGLVYREEVDEVGAERVFRREADLDALGLDKVDDFDRGLGDVGHVLAVRELAEEGRGTDDDVHAVHARLDRDARIVHVAPNVGKYFGVQAELADGLAVAARLLGGRGRGQLQILDAKLVEGFGDRDLGLGVKEGIGKLLPLCVRAQKNGASVQSKSRKRG